MDDVVRLAKTRMSDIYMEHIKKRKFTLVGIFILVVYSFLIWPYPEHYPLLTHSLVRLVVLVLFGLLAYLDDRNETKNK